MKDDEWMPAGMKRGKIRMPIHEEDGATERTIENIKKGKELGELLTVTPLMTVSELLNEQLGKRELSTEALFEQAGLSRAFGYKVLNGSRQPSRDTLLRLAFVLEMDIRSTQLFLKCGRHARLTAHDVRDVVIMKALNDKLSLSEIDALLLECNQAPLIDKCS